MANITQLRLSGTTYTIVDSTAVHSLAGYATEESVQTSITALAESIAEQGYQTSGDVQNAITTAVTQVNNALTAHTSNTDIHVTVADKTAWNAKLDESDVAGLFGNVNYDSTTHRINFYHESTGGTVLAYIDATDFVKDGFLESVTIENKTISGESVPCLVFIWNAAAGIQETDIPLSGIFDPTNYVSVSDFNTYTAATATAIGGKVDTSTFETYSGSVETALSGKQDTLVSGTNIKTINGNSVLGSGNITIEPAGTVDTVMSDSSTNAVQNKVIKAYADTKNPMAYLDGETLIIS